MIDEWVNPFSHRLTYESGIAATFGKRVGIEHSYYEAHLLRVRAGLALKLRRKYRP